ncbi:beta-lactamase regulating signal transducer with metallopeptidase domain [Streptacidiphilus sp. MAP12-16]|uniref:M48 family metalloprotease n=1 Tax=Streptacidiphilus sp. MAP12-16 TaxID=3156300 RepID=UPI003516E93E
MTFDVWAPLVLPLLLAPLLALSSVRSLPDRLPPRLAAWLLTGTAVGLAGAGAVSLGLLALAALLHLPFVAAVGHLDVPVARHLAPGAVVPVGTLAAVLLLVVGVRAARVLHRHLRDHAEARRIIHGHRTGGDLVVLQDAVPDAYALPGGPLPRARNRGRIVVTTGMLRALSAAEREVLLAHERAHLTCRHHRFLLLADLAAALHPLLRPLREGVAYSVERWADETAAVSVADRRLVARAIGRAALAGAGGGDLSGRSRRLAGVAMGVAAGPVPRRVAALLGPDLAVSPARIRRRSALTAALLATVLALSVGSTLDAAKDLHHQVEAAQRPGPAGFSE